MTKVFSDKGSLGNIKVYRYYVENLCEVNNNQIIFSLPLIEKKGIKREIFKTKKPNKSLLASVAVPKIGLETRLARFLPLSRVRSGNRA